MTDPLDSARVSRARAAALVTVFVVLLLLPTMGTLFGWDRERVVEKRVAATLPALPRDLDSLDSWPKKFDAWFEDHFGFRSLHIYWVSRLQLRLFGISTSWLVLVGKPGWFFFKPEVDEHLDRSPMQPEALAAWVRAFESEERVLAARGASLTVFVAPDKSTVYPQALPAQIGVLPPQGRADQVLAALRARGRVRVVDLRPLLVAAAAHPPELYFRTDHHWNSSGGALAAAAILETLGLPRPPRELYREKQMGALAGDLAVAMGLEHELTEPESRLVLSAPFSASAVPVLFIHDSFGGAVLPFLRDALGDLTDFDPRVFVPAAGQRFHAPAKVAHLIVENNLQQAPGDKLGLLHKTLEQVLPPP